jgi:NADPH:quinone reductase-like Zn-dependent oxidoreductase
MRAITISRYGGPEVLTEVELPDPHPGPGQISIDVTHAAVGMIDVIFRRGDLAGDDRYPPRGRRSDGGGEGFGFLGPVLRQNSSRRVDLGIR